MRSVTLAGRLTIIGGGVMGLMTAYHAAPLAEAVTVLDRSQVGDPATASFGLTRSVRNDYRDPAYARLAPAVPLPSPATRGRAAVPVPAPAGGALAGGGGWGGASSEAAARGCWSTAA